MTREGDVLPDKEFLKRIAKEIGSLFPPASREREWLCKQIRVAIEQQIAHDQAEGERDKELLEHCRKLHRYSKWRDEGAGPPRRHPDWVYADWMYSAELTCDEDLGIIMGWGPPELLDDSRIPPQPIHDFYPFGDPPRPAAEVLPACCFILAVVHDASRRGKGFQLLLDGVELPPSLQVCLDHQTDDGSDMQMAGFERGDIEQALSAVKEEVGQQVQGADKKKQPSTESKEVPWDPTDRDFIPAKDAVSHVKNRTGGHMEFDYRDLGRALTPDGPMHYMRNPNKQDKGPGSVQRKVHKGELDTWCDGLRRSAAAKGQQPRREVPKLANSGNGPYQRGFAEGLQNGYGQGYEDVKQGKPYSPNPPFEDDPKDEYVHGQYDGWKKGYADGRLDSERGELQKYGAGE